MKLCLFVVSHVVNIFIIMCHSCHCDVSFADDVFYGKQPVQLYSGRAKPLTGRAMAYPGHPLAPLLMPTVESCAICIKTKS